MRIQTLVDDAAAPRDPLPGRLMDRRRLHRQGSDLTRGVGCGLG